MYEAALLLGRDFTELGEVEIVEVTPELAIGISCGRFPKGYPSVEPNEDAVFAATDGESTVLAVADGHHGAAASHTVIETIATRTRSAISSSDELLARLVDAGLEAVADLGEGDSDTALTVCVSDGQGWEAVTFGDSGVIVLWGRGATHLRGTKPFLARRDVEPDRWAFEVKRRSLLAVATDGFFSFVPDQTLIPRRQSRKWSAKNHVECLIGSAFEGGAGDNIAIAVHRPS